MRKIAPRRRIAAQTPKSASKSASPPSTAKKVAPAGWASFYCPIRSGKWKTRFYLLLEIMMRLAPQNVMSGYFGAVIYMKMVIR